MKRDLPRNVNGLSLLGKMGDLAALGKKWFWLGVCQSFGFGMPRLRHFSLASAEAEAKGTFCQSFGFSNFFIVP